MFKSCIICSLLLVGSSMCKGQDTSGVVESVRQARAADAVNRIAEQIKASDEPALRVFLRLRLAKFLWAEKIDVVSGRAAAVAAEALNDLQANQSEIPGLYISSFRMELLALLQVNAPALAERFVKNYSLDNQSNRLDMAYELLGSQDGGARAIEIVRRNMRGGQQSLDPRIIFFFSRLDETQPAEVDKLLADLMLLMERAPGNYPFSALSVAARMYLYREVTPPELKARFLALLVNGSRNPATLSESELIPAYHLLKDNLATIQKLLPFLYPQAGAQLASLSSLVAKQVIESDETHENIRRNAETLAQLTSEAEKAQDATLKTELLTQAAQMALEEGQLRLAVDLILRAESGDKKVPVTYQDQFLGEVAQKAIGEKDDQASAYAAARITDPLKRASVIQRLALYYFEAQDFSRAQDALGYALKLIGGDEDDARKATAMLAIIPAFLKIDNSRANELARAAIRIINNIPTSDHRDKPGGEAHLKQVEAMMQVAYYLLPAFGRLAQQDEVGAFGLADTLQRHEFKAVAILGASVEMNKRREKAIPSAVSK